MELTKLQRKILLVKLRSELKKQQEVSERCLEANPLRGERRQAEDEVESLLLTLKVDFLTACLEDNSLHPDEYD